MKFTPRKFPAARSTAFRLSPFPPPNPPRQPRGLITVMVIIMFVFIAAAIVSLTLLFATEMRRTHAAVASAQLRQFLLAAAPAAQQELSLHGPTARDIAIPTPIAGATLTAHIAPTTPNQATIRITAKLSKTAAAQTLTYKRSADSWQLQSANLNAQP